MLVLLICLVAYFTNFYFFAIDYFVKLLFCYIYLILLYFHVWLTKLVLAVSAFIFYVGDPRVAHSN